MEYSIYKVGGILIQDQKLLVTRSKGKEFFIAPGGKIEAGEQPLDALKRELMEELGISFDVGQALLFGTFYAPAAGNESSILRMDVFVLDEWTGTPTPQSEIEELAWIPGTVPPGMKVGSIFEHEVIPRLIEKGLIKWL